MTKRLLSIVLLLWLASGAYGQSASTLQISQVRPALPNIYAYLDVEDGEGESVTDIRADQFVATLGSEVVDVTQAQPFEATGKGVAYVILLDKSRSLRAAQVAQIKTALQSWVAAMKPPDRAAVMTFGEEVELVQDFTGDAEGLRAVIDAFEPTDNRTQLHQGLARALEMGRRTDADLPRRLVAVVLSDGQDDFPGGMMREEVMGRIRASNIPIYAIGVSNAPRTQAKEEALRKLGAFARASGGQYLEADDQTLPEAYGAMQQQIRSVIAADLRCEACEADGSRRLLRVDLTAEGRSMFDETQITMRAAPPVTNDSLSQAGTESASGDFAALLAGLPVWAYVLGALLLVGIVALIVYWVRGGEEEPLPPIAEPLPPKKKPEKGVPVELTVIGRHADGERFDVNLVSTAVIGRSAREADVSLPDDEESSRRNAELFRKDGSVYIRDLDSMNGTFVNGVPVTGSYRLQDGDRILIGRTELRVTLPEQSLGRYS